MKYNTQNSAPSSGDSFVPDQYNSVDLELLELYWPYKTSGARFEETRRHLHHYRHAFPADEAGPFLGQDLSVFRFLRPTPSPARAIMRRLRGVNKAACLVSLRRAVDAGLALEPVPGHFAAVPAPGTALSENRAGTAPPQADPADPAPFGTGITDNTAPGQKA